MAKQVINVPYAPKLALSPGIRAGDFVFVSGQSGFQDRKTGKSIEGIEAQTRQCIEHMKQVLEAAGASLDDVVKVTVFLRNVADYDSIHKIYEAYFPKDQPARSTVVTGLVRPSMLIEMECMAYSPHR
ncbi:MAG: RidA family protein [Chloroflexota bacterium]